MDNHKKFYLIVSLVECLIRFNGGGFVLAVMNNLDQARQCSGNDPVVNPGGNPSKPGRSVLISFSSSFKSKQVDSFLEQVTAYSLQILQLY
jgi:hypothetical protein